MLQDENDLVKIELAFEESKASRMRAHDRLKLEKGKYHTQLVARRGAGEELTAKDIEALENSAIEDVPSVKLSYMKFLEADSDYRIKKVKWESAKRQYWDSKPS